MATKATRLLRLTTPYMRGDDVDELQKFAIKSKFGSFAPATLPDGSPFRDKVLGTATEDAIVAIRFGLGYPPTGANAYRTPVAGPRLLRFLRGTEELPAEYAKRRKTRLAVSMVKPLPSPLGTRSEFTYVDAEGAPDNRGVRHHAGKDWFAKGGTVLVSPVAGEVVEARHSSDTSGQVFGGTAKIREAGGKRRVFVFRHVFPLDSLSEGDRVRIGEPVAHVTRWSDWPDGSHAHCELWLTVDGGYDYENMVDPLPVYAAAAPYPG